MVLHSVNVVALLVVIVEVVATVEVFSIRFRVFVAEWFAAVLIQVWRLADRVRLTGVRCC
ncbi:hypothetical protein C2E31_27525 [Rhodopirellula baltica]|nr:hypothetical protein C2E31_27525 [Rhodopirellula baltica]